jgi:hypothetical protein
MRVERDDFLPAADQDCFHPHPTYQQRQQHHLHGTQN